MLTNMAATVCTHKLVASFLPWLLSTAAKHVLAVQSIKHSMVLNRYLAHCMHDLCLLSQQQLETAAKEMSEQPHWKLKGLAVQPGNGLAPFDAFPFCQGAGALEGNMYSCMGLRRVPCQVRLPEHAFIALT